MSLKFWRYLSKCDDTVNQIEVNGTVVRDVRVIANSFTAFFQSVFSRMLSAKQQPMLSRISDA